MSEKALKTIQKILDGANESSRIENCESVNNVIEECGIGDICKYILNKGFGVETIFQLNDNQFNMYVTEVSRLADIWATDPQGEPN